MTEHVYWLPFSDPILIFFLSLLPAFIEMLFENCGGGGSQVRIISTSTKLPLSRSVSSNSDIYP